MTSIEREPIGFIGCGHMGGAMARRLIERGFDLLVHDLDQSQLAPLIELGATPVESVREIADQATVVFACLPSQQASQSVASAVADGNKVKTFIETSTIGQNAMVSIAERLNLLGIAVLDMPVSGGPSWAREGKLTGILSGPAHVRDSVGPLLNCIAGRVIVVGDKAGLGQVAKVVNNALSLTGLMIACEAIVAGVKAGADATALLEVINVSTGRNSATVDKFPQAILPRTFKFGGPIGLGNKDLELYLDLDRAEPSSIMLGHAVADFWKTITDNLGGDADLSEMVRYFEKIAGVEVRGHSHSE
jgi:3-hydroxyisobutyrate dehydrogenase-like beta-hydroxyacid dehydrogenase